MTKPITNNNASMVSTSNVISGKWTIPVVCILQGNTLRFSEIEKALSSITQRALTLTLRKLERNGMLDRLVYPAVPPQVEYKLTPLGLELLQFCETMNTWAKERETDMQRARRSYARHSR